MSLPFWDGQKRESPDVARGKLTADNVWDSCDLAGRSLPGIVTVKINRPRRIDVKKKGGTDSTTMTNVGVNPAKVTITMLIWTPEQLDSAQEIALACSPRPNSGTRPTPLDIDCPVASFHKVASIVVEDVAGPEPGPAPQTKVLTLQCMEFVPPDKQQAVVVTHKASKPPVARAFNALGSTTTPANAKATKPSQNKRDTGPGLLEEAA